MLGVGGPGLPWGRGQLPAVRTGQSREAHAWQAGVVLSSPSGGGLGVSAPGSAASPGSPCFSPGPLQQR